MAASEMPTRSNEARHSAWWNKNWVAVVGCLAFAMASVDVWRSMEARSMGTAVEALLDVFFGTVFVFLHYYGRKSEEQLRKEYSAVVTRAQQEQNRQEVGVS